jgi:DNA primase
MFDRAAREFGKADRAIVVEGYFDCIALQNAGFRETVATLGTALSEHHARELARKVERVVVCFDGDDAGRNAARVALRTLLATGVEVRILLLPEGRDPDDIVRKEGAAGVAGRLEASLDAVDFLMDRTGGSAGDRRARLAECLEIVDVTPDPTRRYTLQAELAKRAQIPLDQIRPMQSPRVIAARTGNDDTALPLEMALLRALLLDLPLERRSVVAQEVPVELLATPVVCRVMEAIKAIVAEHGTLEISALTSHIDDRDARRLLAALEHEAPETPEDRLSLILRELWERQRKRRLAELSNRIAQAERQGDHDQLTELSLEWSLLLKQPKKL